MIPEYVLLCSPNKNADSVSCQTEPCLSQRVALRMEPMGCPFGALSIVSLPNDKSRKDRLMKRRKLVALSAVFVTAVAALLISSQTVLVSAHNGAALAQQGQKGDPEEPPPPFYNPYPFGILPPDLPQEIERVL